MTAYTVIAIYLQVEYEKKMQNSGTKIVYGVEFPKNASQLSIELLMFREKLSISFKKKGVQFKNGWTPQFHFKNIARVLWPEEATKDQPVNFIWHPWADRMLDGLCRHDYLAVAGPGGFGKSEICAIWAIINFICDPKNTLCMVTSTTISASKKRIWGKVVKYWNAIAHLGFPGKLVDSLHVIRYVNKDNVAELGDMAGISLIPGEKKKEKEAVGKLIGVHSPRTLLICDELSELSPAILEAAFNNLSSGCLTFSLVGLSNPASHFDSFGVFAKPKAGWNSIDTESEEWETERGWAIRFDDLKGPNILAGETIYPWMTTQEDLDREMAIHGGKTASFWRMRRGFWCPEGSVEKIYTESEIINAGAMENAIWLDNDLTKICFLDPSWTNGGDRAILYFGVLGKNKDGIQVLQDDGFMEFHEDVTNQKQTRSEQLIRWWRLQSEQRGIQPKNAGYDSTGGGGPFGDMVKMIWSEQVQGIHFGGAADESPVSAFDPTPCNERYVNKVSAIWYSTKELLRTGQIKGLKPDLIQEMTSRKKSDEKGLQLRIRVQSKREMKLETGKSPDIGDAWMGVVMLCRERMGLTSEKATKKQPQSQNAKAIRRRLDIFANSNSRLAA